LMNEFACDHGPKDSTERGDQYVHMNGLKVDSPGLSTVTTLILDDALR